MSEQKPESQSLIDELYESGQLFRTIGEIRKVAKPLEPLWGYFLFRKAITSIVGDPGAGKTTFGYALSASLCRNKAFLDIKARSEVNVLFMDFESADALVKSRANLVIQEDDIPNLYIYNVADFYVPQVTSVMLKFCKENKISLVFIDNQTMAFNTRDENDNAEAAKQMRYLRELTNKCNVATVLFHHTSKANMPGTRKGTGAYARARLADICINLDLPDIDNYPDIVKLEVSKNRFVDDRPCWYLKKDTGGFSLTDPPLGMIGKIRSDTKTFKIQNCILDYMKNVARIKRQELILAMQGEGHEERMVQEAIDRLKQIGGLYSAGYGYYTAVSEYSSEYNADS